MLARLIANPSFLIVVGSILIGLGGFLATYGWDLRSSEDTRRALEQRAANDLAVRRQTILRTLAAEYVSNEAVLKAPAFVERDDNQLSKFAIFPRLQTTAITTAIASGLFAAPADNELFTALFEFQHIAGDFNNRLQTTENAALQNRESILYTRTKLRDGKTLSSVRAHLQRLGRVLLANGIDPNEKFFELNDPTD